MNDNKRITGDGDTLILVLRIFIRLLLVENIIAVLYIGIWDIRYLNILD